MAVVSMSGNQALHVWQQINAAVTLLVLCGVYVGLAASPKAKRLLAGLGVAMGLAAAAAYVIVITCPLPPDWQWTCWFLP